jgi:hypothetical protein
MNQTKPISTHIKPFLACGALIVFALGYSWAVPFIFVTCMRSGEQVECVVQQRMIGFIPFDTTTIEDLRTADFLVEQGTRNATGGRTTDTAYLRLTDASGTENKVMLESGEEMIMTRSETFAKGIESFLASDESEYSNWTVSLIGYGALVPAALGLLFLSLVTWDFVGTRLKSLRSGS